MHPRNSLNRIAFRDPTPIPGYTEERAVVYSSWATKDDSRDDGPSSEDGSPHHGTRNGQTQEENIERVNCNDLDLLRWLAQSLV
jgi:hypothetical protein